MKKILVTGANGFIGKSVTRRLMEGHSVDVYCRELKKSDPSFITDNQLDLNILVSPCRDVIYDYVINCIACSDTSSEDWDSLYDANCNTTNKLIANLNFKNFVQLSSFSIYSKYSISAGTADPQNFYGLSKFVSEKLLEINASEDKKFIILRMPIVIGSSKNQSDIVSYLYKSLIDNKTVNLFNDGKYLRNIIHVNEVAESVNELVTRSKITEEYCSINLNSSNTMSVFEICRYMKDKLNSESKIQFIDKPSANDFDSLVVTTSQIIDGYECKSCSQSIDCFLEEMNFARKKSEVS
ncbi:NAD(P)-dependent oxidoreductase [Amylibacter sp.]|nr:NAD(P)-dependent oxidoreductase [Amylibacter sp.]